MTEFAANVQQEWLPLFDKQIVDDYCCCLGRCSCQFRWSLFGRIVGMVVELIVVKAVDFALRDYVVSNAAKVKN